MGVEKIVQDLDEVAEYKGAGKEHHDKKRVYRQKKEGDDSDKELRDFSHEVRHEAFQHSRTHNLNKPRTGKAPQHGYHRPDKQASHYAKKMDVLPALIHQEVEEAKGDDKAQMLDAKDPGLAQSLNPLTV